MMNNLQKLTTLYRNGTKGPFMVALPPLLLVALLVALLVMMVSACTKFTQKTLHTTALKNYLLQLQTKILAQSTIDPEAERKKMEVLQNNIKSSCDPQAISGNEQLKGLFAATCKWIQSANYGKASGSPSWLQFRELVNSFNETYFFPNTRPGTIGLSR